MSYTMIDEGVPLLAGNIVLEINRKTLNEPETYLGFETKVKIEDQIPAGESTGVDIPGQLWKQYHKEKERFAEYLNPDVELGMSYRLIRRGESLPILQEGWQAKRRYRKDGKRGTAAGRIRCLRH